MRLVSDTTPLGQMPMCSLVGATVAPDEARGVKGGEESPVSWVATRWCGADGRRGSPPVEVRLASLLGRGRGLFLFLAAVALLAPWLLTERATLRIDEGAGRAYLVRRALWRRKREEWPIERLRGAEVVRSGLSVSVRLRLDGGETADVAWPTWGDGGHAAFASQVNELLATRGRPSSQDRGSTGEA
jgi:hypothetical protein